jgi:holo-[acyl-carrier protein] synthase
VIIGLGIDLVQISSFQAQLEDPATSFLDATFTEAERDYCRTAISRLPTQHLAARYAAKEAALKALDAACALAGVESAPLPLDAIEVVRDSRGRPYLCFHGAASELAEVAGVDRIHLSLTHETDYASAVVCLERIT